MAGRKPKAVPQTMTEMIETGKQMRSTSKIYKAEADEIKDEAISKSVNDALTALRQSDSRQRVSLDDYPMVRAICESYLESCVANSTFPFMDKLAIALGHTRQNLNYYMRKHSETETGKLLNQLHDMFAIVLAENSLRNNANNVTSIFILKSLFGYRETPQSIELVQGSLEQMPSADDLIERANLLDD